MAAMRVVVIEDEPAIRRGVVDALRASGYDVAEAADGVRGTEEALRRGVDLVLLDLLLPRYSFAHYGIKGVCRPGLYLND